MGDNGQQALDFRWIGLTGGIASGKSTVTRLLRERGVVVLDADAIAREVVEPGSEGLAEVVAAFGPEVLTASGELDRAAMGRRVFADGAALARLNGILHPRIAMETARKVEAARAGGEVLVVYDAPLLVENKLHLGMQLLIVVAVDPATQRARLMARDGLTAEEAEARLASQLPLEAKVALADVVIDNNGSREATVAQVVALLERLPGLLWPTVPDVQERFTAARSTR